MGHSWGGTIMTAFAAAHPERVEGMVLVDSGQMDYQDAPGFPHGKTYEDLVEEARAPERMIRTTAEDFERDAQEGVRRPVTPALMEAFRAGLREEGGQLVSIVAPETRASAMFGLMGTRVTECWPAIAEERIPILLLLATEPEEAREQNGRAAKVFAERFPDAEIHFLENAGHDLFADAGPELARIVAEWVSGLRASLTRPGASSLLPDSIVTSADTRVCAGRAPKAWRGDAPRHLESKHADHRRHP